MKRYCVSRIIGTGASIDDPFRPKVSTHLLNYVADIPTGADGKPLKTWCICQAAGSNLTPLLSDADIDALPDLGLDVKLTAISNGQLIDLRDRLAARGVNVSAIRASDAFRTLLRLIGRLANPLFDENAFSVAE